MSSPLAIAGTTFMLRELIIDAFAAGIPGVADIPDVSVLPPDRATVIADDTPSGVNLFLYQVIFNNGWRNAALPARDDAGSRRSNPPLALNLRYLLTAYSGVDFEAELLLGVALLAFWEAATLPRSLLRDKLEASPFPQAADLAEQVEQLRLVPLQTDMDEMARIWSAIQAPYRTSICLEVSVILIEGARAARTPLPVREYGVYPNPLLTPFIERVSSQAAPADPVVERRPVAVGERLVLDGRGLASPGVRVRFGDGTAVVPAQASSSRIVLVIPPTLRAGVQGARVVHSVMMGNPASSRPGEESNVAPFVLRPLVMGIAGTGPAGSIDIQTDPETGLQSTTLLISADPGVGWAQRTELLLSEFGAPAGRDAHGYSFRAVVPTPLPRDVPGRAELRFELSGVEPGRYVARLRIDDAESQPEMNAGVFARPLVDLR